MTLDSRLKMSGMTDWCEMFHFHLLGCRQQACMRNSCGRHWARYSFVTSSTTQVL